MQRVRGTVGGWIAVETTVEGRWKVATDAVGVFGAERLTLQKIYAAVAGVLKGWEIFYGNV